MDSLKRAMCQHSISLTCSNASELTDGATREEEGRTGNMENALQDIMHVVLLRAGQALHTSILHRIMMKILMQMQIKNLWIQIPAVYFFIPVIYVFLGCRVNAVS